jgi:hypothetical protein
LEILLDLSFILRPENCAYFSEDAAPNQFWTPSRRERPGSSPSTPPPPQIRLYARFWGQITGEPVLESGLYFTSADRWVKT